MYYTYNHIDSSVNSIEALMNDVTCPLHGYIIDKGNKKYKQVLNDFLNYDGGTGLKNLDRIFSRYSDFPQDNSEKEANIGKYNSNSLDLIKVNTEILIPYDKCNMELLSISGKNLFTEQRNFDSFLASQLLSLLSDRKYVKKDKFSLSSSNLVSESYPNVSVWIYSRILDRILNVTDFVESLNTSSGKGGGSFNMNLSAINDFKEKSFYGSSGHRIVDSHLYKDENKRVRNRFFFHEKIIANDLVFIKFEELAIKEENRDKSGLYIDKSNIADQVYDMIGLVDSNNISSDPERNDVSIRIVGRDLTKLLVEDGSYFMPLVFVKDSTNFFVNIDTLDSDKFIKRNFVSGTYDRQVLFANVYRSIAFTLQFIINQCANIGIIPDNIDLFSGYKGQDKNGKIIDRRTYVYRIGQDKSLEQKLHEGVWQIVKLNIDSNLDNRRLADDSISQPDGSIFDQFRKVCQEPFVEFFGDTYGDTYNIVVRQPPFTKSQIISFLDNKITVDESVKPILYNNDQSNSTVIDIFEEDIEDENLEFNQDNASTWYQLDSKVINFQSSESILNYIPIVYLPEYVNVWGNKRRYVVSNYISYEAIAGTGKNYDLNIWNQSVVNDLKYLIDSECYLPFTRRGSITLNAGDRRIKKGTWIRHNGTKEIYYVDAVINNATISTTSINRSTILQVSRGMVEKYVRGVFMDSGEVDFRGGKLKKGSIEFSYFNIVDTEIIKKTILERLSTSKSISTKVQANFGVNKAVFDFFLKNKQFDDK